LQDLEESETILGCLELFANLASEFIKLRVVRASRSFEDLNDAHQIFVLQGFVENSKVSMSSVPVVDLIQGGAVVVAGLGLLISYEVFYLARPVDHDRF
jgi:hypothetical protein